MTLKPIRLVSSHEIREMLGRGRYSRQRIYQLTSGTDFPNPVARLIQGKIWLTDDVEAWIREHRPTAGANAEPTPST